VQAVSALLVAVPPRLLEHRKGLGRHPKPILRRSSAGSRHRKVNVQDVVSRRAWINLASGCVLVCWVGTERAERGNGRTRAETADQWEFTASVCAHHPRSVAVTMRRIAPRTDVTRLLRRA
jgi:hypothetical protein